MERSDVTRDDGTWVGLSLDVQDRHQPGLRMFSAGQRLLLSRLSRPVLLAVVGEHPQGVDFWRTGEYHSFIPPPRADAGRALAAARTGGLTASPSTSSNRRTARCTSADGCSRAKARFGAGATTLGARGS